ncbi:polysaccharide lyase family 8 super-sandwich domain-containing protein [Sphingobacterium tabacisoli]|uniref:polysaccharide lyase family 8 super-sandwich domain-containing protein n=1 Tax=Sphingobacterium tabacisoli TaxID=2044855 RepID=UPI001AEDF278|nr:polysaccharide lyase family 8 super-sandwich domain-containing protein [Sphingobacterium tabacisoli]
MRYADVYSNDSTLFNRISRQLHEQQLKEQIDLHLLDKNVGSYLATLDLSTGEWPEFDYKDHKRINPSWIPVLERMRLMTVAYTHPQSIYFESEILQQAINKSLYFFTSQERLPYCDNWYIQGITRPQSLTKSLLNMRLASRGLDPEVEGSLRTAICIDTAVNSPGRNNPNHKYNFGANKAQIAKGWIVMGAVLEDVNMLELGVREVYSPIQQTVGEGIQYDMSYDMHYGYLYNGSYGVDFMQSVVETAMYTKGTAYALKGQKLELFRHFVIESIFGLMRGSYMDWNVLGRGISRFGATKKDFRVVLDRLVQIDPQARDIYGTIRERLYGDLPASYGVQSSHRHYWTTDYTVHKRAGYTFSIHAVSDRNFAQEIGNQENLQGYWGAQGTTNLQLKGGEYYNIFPLWDWARLPGTTLPDTVPILKDKAPGSGDRRGTDSFSGGVSDSLYGVTAYVVNDDLETSYKKSWFMFDEEIVCLGTGISSTGDVAVNTNLNQCLLGAEGIFLKEKANSRAVALKSNILKGRFFGLWHDDVGYYFPTLPSIELSINRREGDWSAIRSAQQVEKKEVKDVFQLSIPHGMRPENATYAYILYPGIGQPEAMQKMGKDNRVNIVCNTNSLQAVYHKKLKIHQIAFYSSDAVYEDEKIRIKTDTPVLLMLKKTSNKGYELYVSDPTQKHGHIELSVFFKKQNSLKQFPIDLAGKPYGGQSKGISFNL